MIRYSDWKRETSNWGKYPKGTLKRFVFGEFVICEETYYEYEDIRHFEFYNKEIKCLLSTFNRAEMNDIHDIIHFCGKNPFIKGESKIKDN